jgi:pimeloyl-ACP methyl ester carboxylesterase
LGIILGIYRPDFSKTAALFRVCATFVADAVSPQSGNLEYRGAAGDDGSPVPHLAGRRSVAGTALDASPANPQAWRMADHSTSVIAVRGCRIRLMRGGAGDPLLYLHGASGASWLPFLQTLTQKYDVIAPEHPGFGESDTPDWLDNIADLAYFYLDLLDELKLEGVHLVGNSLGGWIAAELAVRSTQRLASLTLAGSAGLNVPGVKQLDSFLVSDEQRLRQFFYDPKRADEMIARVLDPKHEDVALRNQATVAKLVWQPRSHDPHLAKWLHRIDVPTLLIWGDTDRMFPKEHAVAFQKAISGAKLVMIPKCGHVPQIEKPDEFIAALESFIGARKKAA